MTTRYDIGDKVILTGIVTKDGNPFSGTGDFTVRVPGEEAVEAVTTNESPTGTYTGIFGPITVSGRHFYRLEITGSDQGAEEKWFDVRPQRV